MKSGDFDPNQYVRVNRRHGRNRRIAFYPGKYNRELGIIFALGVIGMIFMMTVNG